MEKDLTRCSTRIWGQLLFKICKSDCKIFIDDTFLFSKTINKKHAEVELNRDLKLISQWAYPWKMLLNPNLTKQSIEVCFLHKRNSVSHQPLAFNENKNKICNFKEKFGTCLRF